MERIQIGGRRIAGFGIGQAATYVLGREQIPHDAPTGSIVQESPGSPYGTSCTKQADGSWICSNGSVFKAGDLERRGGLTCKSGEIVSGQWGLCVPPDGLALSTIGTILPDGSIKASDGTIVFDGATGKWSLTTMQELQVWVDTIKTVIADPVAATAIGAEAIGKATAQIASSTAKGASEGMSDQLASMLKTITIGAVVVVATVVVGGVVYAIVRR